MWAADYENLFWVLENNLFRSKNTKYSKDIVFFKNHIDFFDENSTTVSGKNSKNLEVTKRDKIIHCSTQVSMLIQNIIDLSHKSVALMMKIEIHQQNYWHLVPNLEKLNLLSN
jgi:hypothetical protein